jgi:surface protein
MVNLRAEDDLGASADTYYKASSLKKGAFIKSYAPVISRNSPNSTNTTSTSTIIGDTVIGTITDGNGNIVGSFVAQYITQSPSHCSDSSACFHSLTDAPECSIEAYANSTKIVGADYLKHDANADGKWQIYVLNVFNSTETNSVYMHDGDGEPFACSNLEPIATQEEMDELDKVLTDVLREQLAVAADNNTIVTDVNATTTGGYETLSDGSTNATIDTNTTETKGEAATTTSSTTQYKCFTTRDQLRQAALDYFNKTASSLVKQTYGNMEDWCVSAVTDMYGIFAGLPPTFNVNLGNWDVSNVVNMSYMFDGAFAYTGQGLNGWDVSKVIDMHAMFADACCAFNADLSNWDTSNVQDMSQMFANAQKYNQDLSMWDISAVKNMDRMFHGAQVFNQNLCAWGSNSGDFPYSAAKDIFSDTACEDSPNVDTKGPFCASLCETSIDSTSASSMTRLAPLAIVMMSSLIISMLK